MAVKKKSSNKNPSVFSHEFLIQNHADMVACTAMLLVMGLMFHVTSPVASMFVTLQHNVTLPIPEGQATDARPIALYTYGLKDGLAIFFYIMLCIVAHQIIQEYLLDKVNRRLHLSKIKHAKFNESGQLLTFYLVSLAWAGHNILRENLLNIRFMWEGYPHTQMTFVFKLFFIVQISYWLHIFPELYFQKIKREDMYNRIQYASLYLGFIASAYVFNFTRVALVLLAFQYAAEAVFHACRLLSYHDKESVARPLYHVHEAIFVLARLGTISLAVLTFWYGLARAPMSQQVVDLPSGTFNTLIFRIAVLTAIGLLQAWQMWNFITFHIRRMRENATTATSGPMGGQFKPRKTQQEKAKARKERAARDGQKEDNNDLMDLPEVDQNTKKTLRQRK